MGPPAPAGDEVLQPVAVDVDVVQGVRLAWEGEVAQVFQHQGEAAIGKTDADRQIRRQRLLPFLLICPELFQHGLDAFGAKYV